MKFTPSESLSSNEINKGLKLVVKDGLAAEAMATLTGGAFLIAFALKFGASNFQIGLFASMPTLTNLFQLVAIYLVYLIGNRKSISVFSTLFARIPLLAIGFLPILFSAGTSLNLLILFLFFHYLFGAISGCSWTSWMKDLVPEEKLGTYFSNRSRLIQITNVILSLGCAFLLDAIKVNFPEWEMRTYSTMFFLGGIAGIYGAYVLSKVPEPKMRAVKSDFLKLFVKPFKNINFRNLMIFNSFWAFAINLAAPFFSVYLLKILHLPLSYVVGFNILSQVTNILFIRIWGRYSDKYSNKTILKICSPIYLACILAWTFTTMPHPHYLTIPLLVVIYIFNGVSVAGINLSLTNIGLKLAPKEGDAIVYLTTRGMLNALFAGIAPVIGGYFADFFSKRQFSWNFEWKAPDGAYVLHTLNLEQWDFFFLFAFILGILALNRLSFVKEKGEVRKRIVVHEIAKELKKEFKNTATFAGVKTFAYIPFSFFSVIKRKKRIDKARRERLLENPTNVFALNKNDQTGRSEDKKFAKGLR